MDEKDFMNIIMVLLGLGMITLCTWFGSLIQNSIEKKDPEQRKQSPLRFRMVGGIIGGIVGCATAGAVIFIYKRGPTYTSIPDTLTPVGQIDNTGGTPTLSLSRAANVVGKDTVKRAQIVSKASRIIQDTR